MSKSLYIFKKYSSLLPPQALFGNLPPTIDQGLISPNIINSNIQSGSAEMKISPDIAQELKNKLQSKDNNVPTSDIITPGTPLSIIKGRINGFLNKSEQV